MMEDMKKELEKGEMSEAQKQQMAEKLKKMAEELQKSDSAQCKNMAAAMALAAKGMASDNLAEALQSLGMAEMSMADLEKMMKQMKDLQNMRVLREHRRGDKKRLRSADILCFPGAVARDSAAVLFETAQNPDCHSQHHVMAAEFAGSHGERALPAVAAQPPALSATADRSFGDLRFGATVPAHQRQRREELPCGYRHVGQHAGPGNRRNPFGPCETDRAEDGRFAGARRQDDAGEFGGETDGGLRIDGRPLSLARRDQAH